MAWRYTFFYSDKKLQTENVPTKFKSYLVFCLMLGAYHS